ncbi:hypothetical protein Pcinc_029298 [Petrolisthes cinctipes]|uniref:Uncharacterized protein n=1 Tax=Petrolisthes cinctipes TaxID=88211 RepID=A0AAE1F1A7_PETCI|nr:hypothetical protein Pcinc_029298 [Petrolisthes cinctipes]
MTQRLCCDWPCVCVTLDEAHQWLVDALAARLSQTTATLTWTGIGSPSQPSLEASHQLFTRVEQRWWKLACLLTLVAGCLEEHTHIPHKVKHNSGTLE